MTLFESIYIFNNRNICILQHPASSTAVSGADLITAYLSCPSPRSSVLLLPNRPVPTVAYSVTRDELLLVTLMTREAEPLEVLELLHRLLDILEDFLGAPLLPWKVQDSYDLVGQILGELLDGGLVAVSESNAFQDAITRPGWMEKLLSGVRLPSAMSSIGAAALPNAIVNRTLKSDSNEMPAPWRKANVRYTINKMTIDVVENIEAIFAPSGRPLSARANGSIAFTCEVSGVPDVLLTLTTTQGGRSNVGKVMQFPVFHPCVRLSRWRDRVGELSFVPPDGRFLLAGYESDLLGPDYLEQAVDNVHHDSSLRLPVTASLHRASDPADKWGMEVHLTFDPDFISSSGAAALSTAGGTNSRGGSAINMGSSGVSSSVSNTLSNALASTIPSSASSSSPQRPMFDNISVHVPVPYGVQSFGDVRASVGEAFYSYSEERLVWRISGKLAMGLIGNRRSSEPFVAATLRCTVVTADNVDQDDNDDDIDDSENAAADGGADDAVARKGRNPGEYMDDLLVSPRNSLSVEVPQSRSKSPTKSHSRSPTKPSPLANVISSRDLVSPTIQTGASSSSTDKPKGTAAAADQETEPETAYFPTVATVHFQVTGWLASGLKIHELTLDQQKSKGIGNNVLPYKRVKYVSSGGDDGIEIRCNWDSLSK